MAGDSGKTSRRPFADTRFSAEVSAAALGIRAVEAASEINPADIIRAVAAAANYARTTDDPYAKLHITTLLGALTAVAAQAVETNRQARELMRDVEELERRLAMEEAISGRLREANEVLEVDTRTDRLTGIWNRRALERVGEELCRTFERENKPLSVLFIDLNFFKQINDDIGFDAGDKVLIDFAEMMKKCFRTCDFSFGRYGGDEFVVLLPNTTSDEACIPAERFRKMVEDAVFSLEGCESCKGDKPKNVKITISVGVAQAHPEENGGTFEKMMNRADKAKDAANKQFDRNIVVVCNGGIHPYRLGERSPARMPDGLNYRYTITGVQDRSAIRSQIAAAQSDRSGR